MAVEGIRGGSSGVGGAWLGVWQIKPKDTLFTPLLSGKSGVGKTALAARPNMHYETTGIETTVVYWPVKLRENGRVLFFRLQRWDCGENALRRFDHLLPACKEQVDTVLFLFSFTDRTSFDDLSNHIAKWTGAPVGRFVKLVVGTKFDLFMHCDVAERDFQETWSVPVLRVDLSCYI
ncbi:ciliogenesis and planar polarity effector 2-like [Trematomus bernacchii]|uniref:ciliogenesis and planar polarity effector 2-like n=1 Tax=Trematomus bernacchii TaxID=40690 RepID=UPI00146B08C0|nr:ciliogenesis and planar polarity effector 2-like [Trematomus bernacchii]